MKLTTLTLTLLSIALSPLASAHCQIPCGIYADDAIYTLMLKDQETIAKSMQQITALSKDPSANANQIARWVTNKEQHAQSIQDTVAEYYLAQRIKIDEKDKEAYIQKLTLLHQITVYAMKCKQTTDSENTTKLKQALKDFHALYAKKKK